MPKVDNTLFYEKSLLKHGPTPQGVHWNSKESQYTRFKVLTSFIHDLPTSTVCDAGCGYGELYGYLINNNNTPLHYEGIDVEEMMISLALESYDTQFFQKDVLHDELNQADYYLCSGAMNTLTQKESKTFIQNCYNHSKKGFAFNILEYSKIENLDTYNGFELDEILTFCEGLSDEVFYIDEYLDGDITIFMKR